MYTYMHIKNSKSFAIMNQRSRINVETLGKPTNTHGAHKLQLHGKLINYQTRRVQISSR